MGYNGSPTASLSRTAVGAPAAKNSPVIDPGFWGGRRVLITGHTGFKGAWLALWLHALGAEVHGFAAPSPTTPSLFALTRLDELVSSRTGDIRDLDAVEAAVAESRPEVVFHLAAQALVRTSLADPVGTFSTNVLGIANLLEGLRRHGDDVRAVVCVTSDKCYVNREWDWGYRETDALGGLDPYSSSKACQELVAASYRDSLLDGRVAVATARAGNVIGGGDWAEHRLVPDVMQAAVEGRTVTVRNPDSVRPWQHVLNPLSGYVRLAERLVEEGRAFAEAWNFSPSVDEARSVSWLVERLRSRWPGELAADVAPPANDEHEARLVKLDASKARERLGWVPLWSLERGVDAIVEWYDAYRDGRDLRAVTLSQIEEFGR
jgi:CDP-glucose 4,6-dehydratase